MYVPGHAHAAAFASRSSPPSTGNKSSKPRKRRPAVPPPAQRRLDASGTSRSFLQQARAVKPVATHSLDRSDSDARLDERDETPCTHSNSRTTAALRRLAVQESSERVHQQTLAYDELLRYQRGRTEDMTRLVSLVGSEREAFQRAAGFREEWRIGAYVSSVVCA